MIRVEVLNAISGQSFKLAVVRDTIGLELQSQISIEIAAPLSHLILLWDNIPVKSSMRLRDLIGPDQESMEITIFQMSDLPENEEVTHDVPIDRMELYWLGAKIRIVIEGVRYRGQVVEVERGERSNQRLYRILYSDGELQHFVEDEVLRYLDRDDAEKKQLWKRLGLTSERFWRIVHAISLSDIIA